MLGWEAILSHIYIYRYIHVIGNPKLKWGKVSHLESSTHPTPHYSGFYDISKYSNTTEELSCTNITEDDVKLPKPFVSVLYADIE